MSYTPGINSSTSLMGFSVHQPAIGAPLQFFPAMGSKQLDEMIDAYVPGDASILDKRATVSMEFFEHSMATGELFKFFMVYPALGSATESPSIALVDSGYISNFTSPVMSESQWTQASNISSSSEHRTQKQSHKKTALSNDFSHLPGMKILTKDGQDVTNSASRGCKTKEQRDHAHLMRIIKACDSCRRKKVRCDPSHKRSSGSSAARTAKKTKKAAAPSVPASAPPPQTTSESLGQHLYMQSFDISHLSSSSFDSVMSESLVDPTMDWDQFVLYDEEPFETIPYDYDFFFDPAGHLTPTSSNSYSSPSQPITPAQMADLENTAVGLTEDPQAVLPPYLNPGGEAGNNYADFNLYSPGSSVYLDDDPSLSKEVAALSQSENSRHLDSQQLFDFHRRKNITDQDQDQDRDRDTQLDVSVNADHQASLVSREQGSLPTGPDTSSYHEGIFDALIQSLVVARGDSEQISQVPRSRVPVSPGLPSPLAPVRTGEPRLQPWTSPSPTGVGVPSSRLHESQLGSSSPSTGPRKASQKLAEWHSQRDSVAILTSSSGTWCTTCISSAEPEAIAELSSTSQSRCEPGKLPQNNTTTINTGEPISIPLARHTADAVTVLSVSQNIPSSWSSVAGLNARDAPTRHSFSISNPASQNNAALGVAENYGTSDAAVLSASLSKASRTLLSPGDGKKNHVERRQLLSASLNTSQSQTRSDMQNWTKTIANAVAACLLVFAYAPLRLLHQWTLLSNKAGELQTTGIFVGSLSVAVAYTMWRQHSMGMLDLATQVLPFPRRLAVGTNTVRSRYAQLSEGISRMRGDLESNFSLHSFKKTKALDHRMHRMTSLV
ncbi:hypothetical protein F4813DRAFT_344789 [Daldinia decipiens]|uniref:uncharacterized protein n=1 Tax=Daldinia decipiens TaxID=326647 RepID=UPI0020C1CD35|nr:uncharacterized protein F4813DRAFT_344789 [Daldinia decipiens]KAI1662497.1 hypothetical protein F4813DRAFT_344789 [Daldinia decipiens]